MSEPTDDGVTVTVEERHDNYRTGLGEPCEVRYLTVSDGESTARVVAVRREARANTPHGPITEREHFTEAWAFEADDEWDPKRTGGGTTTHLFHFSVYEDVCEWEAVIDEVRDNAHRVL